MDRLKTPRLQSGRKKHVHIDPSLFRLAPTAMSREDAQKELDRIRTRITEGLGLEEFRYRRGVDETHDGMLARTGYNHLHLQPDSADLLYLVEYEEVVVFLEVSGHAPFDDHPPGESLGRKYEQLLKRLEQRGAAEIVPSPHASSRPRSLLGLSEEALRERIRAGLKRKGL